MKPRTRFYVYVTFLLVSVFCLGASAVMCLIDASPKSFLMLAIVLMCSAVFFRAARQMIDRND